MENVEKISKTKRDFGGADETHLILNYITKLREWQRGVRDYVFEKSRDLKNKLLERTVRSTSIYRVQTQVFEECRRIISTKNCTD